MKKHHALLFIVSSILVGLAQPGMAFWLAPAVACLGYAVPIFLLSASGRFAFAFFWALVSTCISLSWVLSYKYLGMLSLVLYGFLVLMLALPQAFFLVHASKKNLGSLRDCASCAAIATLLEWLRLFVFCGFGFHFSGLSLCVFALPLQLASVVGVLGLSFCVWITNLLAVRWVRDVEKKIFFFQWALTATAPYLIGFVLLSSRFVAKEEFPYLNVMLVQTGNYPSQKMKMRGFEGDYIPKVEQLRSLFIHTIQKIPKGLDLIVFPEATVSGGLDYCIYPIKMLDMIADLLPEGYENALPPLEDLYTSSREGQVFVSNAFWFQLLANLSDAQVVVGLDYGKRGSGIIGNSAISFYPKTNRQEAYSKKILVPFAEYLPWTFLKRLAEAYGIYGFYSSGEFSNVIPGKVSLGVLMCIEELIPEFARAVKNEGARIFIALSNDGWFPQTILAWQHFYYSRLRSVENGIPMLRACATGVTSVISCYGDVLDFLPPDSPLREARAGSLLYDFSAETKSTMYSIWGDGGIVCLCFFLIIIGKKRRYRCN